ncbi:hypothetical protein [uncultured Sphingomonas sp.]|uniref:hypothetical protein n=1 Tax=uncultured Sphingomonas sp. TaxID=158754 RepID=UPI0035CC1268
MDRQADSDESSVCFAAMREARIVTRERPLPTRLIHTDIPEQLPVLQNESELVLQHIGDLLASIFAA